MKLKNKLQKRLMISLGIGLFFFLAGCFAFYQIQNGEKVEGAALIHREAFLWNEKVWTILRSNKRLSVKKPRPDKSKEPRVNGMLGLETELDLKNYVISVESPLKHMTLPVNAFHVIPKTSYSTDFRCIEGWSEETHYAGARFSDFMKFYDIGKKSDGTYYSYVGLETPDKEYYVSIDMESMLHEQTVLAYETNEHPLSLENGAPLRLVIPIKYGIKSLKRIGKIYFSDERPKDYWAEQGYDWFSGL